MEKLLFNLSLKQIRSLFLFFTLALEITFVNVLVSLVRLPFWLFLAISSIVLPLTLLVLQRFGLMDDIFRLVFSEEYKNKLGLHSPPPVYKPRWRSKEFDEFVGEDVINLYADSMALYKNLSTVEFLESGMIKQRDQVFRLTTEFNDYSFVVFPFAKAFEGVLKKILVEAGFLKEGELLEDPSLSINKYFNPVGNQKILESVKDKTRDKAIPYVIYSTYQECRNQIIHYDSYRDNRVKSLDEARFYLERIEDAIEKAYDAFKK